MLKTFTDSIVEFVHEPGDAESEVRKVPDYPDIKWSLHILEKQYEREYDGDDGKRLGVYIRVTGTSGKVFGSFVIKSEYESTITKPFQFDYVTKGEIGFDNLLPSAYDECIEFCCVATFMPTPEAKAVAPVMVHEMIDPKGPSDVTIVADGKEIKVSCLFPCNGFVVNSDITFQTHRGFLAMVSPVFRAMFGPETIETQTGIVNITDFTHETIKSAIDYCYGHLFNDKPAAEVTDMLRFYDKYDIIAAIEKLETYLVDNMTIKNFPPTAAYAWQYSRESLQVKCGVFFYENAKDLGRDEDFAELDSCVIGNVVKAGVAASKKSISQKK